MNDTPPQREAYEEQTTMWGINRNDKGWFNILTIAAGTPWTVEIAITTLRTTDTQAVPAPAIIAAGMTAAFTASGLGAWIILNIKDTVMSIADRIRKGTFERLQAVKEEGRNEGRAEGRNEGRAEAIKEITAKLEADGNTAAIEKIREMTNGASREN